MNDLRLDTLLADGKVAPIPARDPDAPALYRTIHRRARRPKGLVGYQRR